MPLFKDGTDLISRKGDRKVFIETGTADGDGVDIAIKVGFEKIYSIELNPELHKKCVEKFNTEEYKNYNCEINLICGNSEIELPKILENIDEPFILWLDAHWSGGPYIGENMEFYLPKELKSILKYSNKFDDSVIIIDDMNHYLNNKQFCSTVEGLVHQIKTTGELKYSPSYASTHLVKF
ncbi:MAG: hypothetical protein ABFC34_14035 [Methanobacterium sp.]